MSHAYTIRWEPSDVLDIITPSDDISCAGVTQQGRPCRWRLDGEIKRQIRELLVQMSRKTPRRALDDLPELVRLCLCETNHRNQSKRVLEEWTLLVRNHATLLESRVALDSFELDSTPEVTTSNSRYINTQTPGSGLAHYSVEDIVAELTALSIRQRELQTSLEYHHPRRMTQSQSPNPNPSPAQSHPRPVVSPPSSVSNTPSPAASSPRFESASSSQESLRSGSRGIRGIFRSRKSR